VILEWLSSADRSLEFGGSLDQAILLPDWLQWTARVLEFRFGLPDLARNEHGD
jgi:hypothetical protein